MIMLWLLALASYLRSFTRAFCEFNNFKVVALAAMCPKLSYHKNEVLRIMGQTICMRNQLCEGPRQLSHAAWTKKLKYDLSDNPFQPRL